MFDQPLDGFEHGLFRLVAGCIVQERLGLFDGEAVFAVMVAPAGFGELRVVVARNRTQLPVSRFAACPNQAAAMSAYPRTLRAVRATMLKSSPAAASRFRWPSRTPARRRRRAHDASARCSFRGPAAAGLLTECARRRDQNSRADRSGASRGQTMWPGCGDVVASPPSAGTC